MKNSVDVEAPAGSGWHNCDVPRSVGSVVRPAGVAPTVGWSSGPLHAPTAPCRVALRAFLSYFVGEGDNVGLFFLLLLCGRSSCCSNLKGALKWGVRPQFNTEGVQCCY